MTCAGDSSQICGGNYAINVYYLAPTTTITTTSTTTSTTSTTSSSISTTATPGPWATLGCYQDQSSRVLPSYSTTLSNNSPSICETTCLSLGYVVAGTEYGAECWCASAVSSGSLAIASSNCNMACPGDSTLSCGGTWAINVYSYKPLSSTTTSGSSTISITTSTATSSSTSSTTSGSLTTSSSTSTPTPSKVVVAHHMVGNTYSYDQSAWSSNIAAAMAGGIDGFALNIGSDSWQPARVADAYAAAAGTSFKLFVSLDMSSLPCASTSDADLIRAYINDYSTNPNQLYYEGKQVVTTFYGNQCTFGQQNLNAAWTYAVKTGVNASIAFIPAFFSDVSTFSSNTFQDGDFNWNGGWPMSSSDIDFSSDAAHIAANSGRYYIAPVTPVFFTHYGPNSYNKNWIYRSDDSLYNARWDLLFQHRDSIDIVEIISWNDYGECHYIGPIGVDQPNSQSWTTGFDHTLWTTMTKYYADAWRNGVYPTITQNKIYISSRPHSKYATASADSVGIPANWQWTDDNVYAVVFSTGTYTLNLSIGSSFGTFAITPGVNTVKLAMDLGSPSAQLVDPSTNVTIISFTANFTIISNPSTYNFNYYIAASP